MPYWANTGIPDWPNILCYLGTFILFYFYFLFYVNVPYNVEKWKKWNFWKVSMWKFQWNFHANKISWNFTSLDVSFRTLESRAEGRTVQSTDYRQTAENTWMNEWMNDNIMTPIAAPYSIVHWSQSRRPSDVTSDLSWTTRCPHSAVLHSNFTATCKLPVASAHYPLPRASAQPSVSDRELAAVSSFLLLIFRCWVLSI